MPEQYAECPRCHHGRVRVPRRVWWNGKAWVPFASCERCSASWRYDPMSGDFANDASHVTPPEVVAEIKDLPPSDYRVRGFLE